MIEIENEKKLFLQLAEERYGKNLTTEQLEQVSSQLKTMLEATRTLWEVKLENSDEPFSIFKPYRRKTQ